MKTNKIIYIFALVVSSLFISCEDRENVTFDSENGQTLVNFGTSSTDLQIAIGSTGNITVPVTVSTSSASERTFNVSVVEDLSTASPTSYSFGNIVVPANSFNGTLSITGTDDGVITTTPEPLVLAVESVNGSVSDGNLTVNILQICPIDASFFLGDYTVTTITPGVFGASTYGGNGNVVTLEVGASALAREFTANYFEDARFSRVFQFSLVCNEVIVPYQDQRVGCSDIGLNTGPSASGNGIYDATDDTSFTVKLTDNFDSDCGGSPVQTEYLFTKVTP